MAFTTPLPSDILCGKDKTFGKHPGNQVYRRMIEETAASYANQDSKQVKMGVTKDIVSRLEGAGARFLRKRGELWEEISNQQARDKTSHALRFWAKFHQRRPSHTHLQRSKTVLRTSSGRTTSTYTTTTTTTTSSKSAKVHRRMVSTDTTEQQRQHDDSIAIFQRQQAILSQSLHQPPQHHHNHHHGNHYNALLMEEHSTMTHHPSILPDGVVSSSSSYISPRSCSDLAYMLQEPLHDSIGEDDESWDEYFIQPSS